MALFLLRKSYRRRCVFFAMSRAPTNSDQISTPNARRSVVSGHFTKRWSLSGKSRARTQHMYFPFLCLCTPSSSKSRIIEQKSTAWKLTMMRSFADAAVKWDWRLRRRTNARQDANMPPASRSSPRTCLVSWRRRPIDISDNETAEGSASCTPNVDADSTRRN